MRIAVVGSGISGLMSAWLLSRHNDVSLFEANDYFGGHTHTHDVSQGNVNYRVDSGFIVYNAPHYPLLTRLFEELNLAWQATTMSFSVSDEASGLEYNAGSLDGLFCQRRNLLSRPFLGMLADLLRFYRDAPRLFAIGDANLTLGQYLEQAGYGNAFRDLHLIPMASALWSASPGEILEFPVAYLIQFMRNHQMLQLRGRPEWRVLCGGSASYVRAMRSRWRVRERLACPVVAVERYADEVQVKTESGIEHFDHAVLACHSDQALALLHDADPDEREILAAIRYRANDAVLHTDARMLPASRKAWAAWNVRVPATEQPRCSVSYCMNLLQGLESPEPFVVTLNDSGAIDPARVLRRMRYHHPQYSVRSVMARARKAQIQGRRNTWFAGAYWGWGFHEDGVRSAAEVADALDAGWTHGIGEAETAVRVGT